MLGTYLADQFKVSLSATVHSVNLQQNNIFKYQT